MENYLMAYGIARLKGAPDGKANKFARQFLLDQGSPLTAQAMQALWNEFNDTAVIDVPEPAEA